MSCPPFPQAKDRDTEKASKALDTAQAAAAAAELRAGEAEEASRKLDAELAGLRARLVQAESGLKVGKLKGRIRAGCVPVRLWSCFQVGFCSWPVDICALLCSVSTRPSQNSVAQARERQVERLERMLEAAKKEQLEVEARRAEAEEAARGAVDEAVVVRQRSVQVGLRGPKRCSRLGLVARGCSAEA